MDLSYSKDEEAFRLEVRDFIRESLPPAIREKQKLGRRLGKADIVTWHRILNRKGWVAPMWPVEHGGTGWDPVRYFIFREELHAGCAPDPLSFNINMVGPVLCAFGSEAQKRRFLPALLNLDIWFCQGFSEPGAGSDLASLKTTAVRDGDHYVVNGEKLWTSLAQHADWMFALVRTDPAAKKQRGISYLLIDMKSPGISLRPIVMLDGAHHANQTYFDNVRVPVENLIGQENKGWDYAKFLLGHERAGLAKVGLSRLRIAQAKALAAAIREQGVPLAQLARFNERIAGLEVELKALEITNMIVVSRMRGAEAGGPDPKISVLKLKGSELQQAIFELLQDMAGYHAMPAQVAFMEGESSDARDPEWAATAAPSHYFSRAYSIFGGTSEIQKNILAKGVLGLA